MVAKKGTTLNKSAEIRKALSQYPNKKPAEIARLLTKQHGVPFRRKGVSSVKAKMGIRPGATGRPVAPAAARKTTAQRPQPGRVALAAGGGVSVIVANLQAYIQRLGKGDLHRLIDML